MAMRAHNAPGLFLTLALAFGVSACATARPPAENADLIQNTKLPACHYNRTGKQRKGITFKNYARPAGKHVIVIHSETIKSDAPRKDGELVFYDDQFKAVLQGYVEWKTEAKHKRSRMMLFFNGGLKTTKSVKDAAVGQIQCIKDDGIYPVYMVWSSGILATYGEQSAYVRNGLLKTELQPSTPLYIASDIAATIARAPQTWLNELSRFFDSVVVSDPKEYSLQEDGENTDLNRGDQNGQCRNARNRTEIGLCLPFRGRGAQTRLDNSPPLDADRIFELARFGVTTPARVASLALVVESGKEAWNNMLRRSRNTVHHPGEFQPEHWNNEGERERNGVRPSRDAVMKKYWRGTGRFARFFQDLETCIQGPGCLYDGDIDDHLKDLKLTLIGHSMGAIVINELAPEFGGLPFENIVFMGAATSIRDTKNSLVPLLRKSREQAGKNPRILKFYNLMLHPKAEAREDSAYGLLPNGSLLEWIDEVLGKPKTMLDRTMGKWRNLREAQKVFHDKVRDQMTFRVFGFNQREWKDNLNCHGLPGKSYEWPEPITHGSFDETNKQFWCPVIWGATSDNQPYRCVSERHPPCADTSMGTATK